MVVLSDVNYQELSNAPLTAKKRDQMVRPIHKTFFRLWNHAKALKNPR